MSAPPLLAVAVGGTALVRRGEAVTWAAQQARAANAARLLAPLASDARLLITHGNSPQVGFLARQAADADAPRPLDALDAETEGMVGYVLAQAVGNELAGRELAVLLTRVLVDSDDPAFGLPAKPVGPVYSRAVAHSLAARLGWSVAQDGAHWRRVVPSPEPQGVLELRSIRVLLDAGAVVVCAGGGGIPVVARAGGGHDGVEAVVDKDLATSLLAIELEADSLVLLTDVDAIRRRFGRPDAQPISRITPEALRAMALPAGTMGPKAEAACRFVEATGRTAMIGALDDAAAVVRGESGTVVAAGQR
ncbi:MAG: carbamate kinase [Acidimicrobiia bacterium]